MYVRDHGRPAFHKALGVDPTEYDYKVFDVCTEISKQVFPVTLNTDDPRFRAGMERIRKCSDKMYAYKSTGKLLDSVKAGGMLVNIAATFARMYLLPVNRKELPAESRLEPSW